MNTYRNIHARQQKHGRSRKKRTGHLLHFILPMLCLILLLCTLASYILNRAGAGLDVISPISSLFMAPRGMKSATTPPPTDMISATIPSP